MIKLKQSRLYCFSPPVMLATFILEVSFAMYIVWRYKMNVITRLIVAMLVFLAIFQGTEFMLCGGLEIPGGTWSRIGYSAITVLPALGIHLVYKLANKRTGLVVIASYLSAAAFVIYFAFITGAISGHTCYANYAVFNIHKASAQLYTLYYYGWLFIGTILTLIWAPQLNRHRKKALYALMAGYLSLLLPTTAVNIADQSTIGGIASIMCGFAIILAGILTWKIAPESADRKSL